MFYGQIYLITNKFNGKVYIGQTTRKLEDRFYEHRREKSTSIIHKAIKKYGEENFIIEQLCIAFNQEDLNSAEKTAIKVFNSLVPNGYNLKSGGNIAGGELHPLIRKKISDKLKGRPSPNKGIPLTEEHKRKIGEKNKGRVKSEETRKKISMANSGERSYLFGKPSNNRGVTMSEETKQIRRMVILKKGLREIIKKVSTTEFYSEQELVTYEKMHNDCNYFALMDLIYFDSDRLLRKKNNEINKLRRKIVKIHNELYMNILSNQTEYERNVVNV